MIVFNSETQRESDISLRSFKESLHMIIGELTFISGTTEEKKYFNQIKKADELKNASEDDIFLMLTK